MALDVLYQDEYIVAVNKPPGLLVHRTAMAADATVFALQMLRDQLGTPVYPAHRLDRKTSGVLLFSLHPDLDKILKKQFEEKKVTKTYHAIVRGYAPASLDIDYALRNEKGKSQAALTKWETLKLFEIDIPLGQHQTSRYSLVCLQPQTGRFHQLRKHAAHIRHPIIGDRPHGCNKQNRMWKHKFGMDQMLLHASELHIVHPVHKTPVKIAAPKSSVFSKVETALRKNKVFLLEQLKEPTIPPST